MNRSLQWKFAGNNSDRCACLWIIWPPFTIKENGQVVQKGKINLGLDLQGGMHILLKVDTAKLPVDAKKDAIDRAIEVIRNRVDQFGVGEMTIQRTGKDNIIVQLPGVTDRERALDIIGKTAHLEFKIVSDDVDALKKVLEKENAALLGAAKEAAAKEAPQTAATTQEAAAAVKEAAKDCRAGCNQAAAKEPAANAVETAQETAAANAAAVEPEARSLPVTS